VLHSVEVIPRFDSEDFLFEMKNSFYVPVASLKIKVWKSKSSIARLETTNRKRSV